MAAFSDYNGLKSQVVAWANRQGDPDFDAAFPGFVELVENELNHGNEETMPPLRVRDMEASASIPLTDGEGDLPADFLEVRSVRYGPHDYDLPGTDYRIVGNTLMTRRQGVSPLSVGYYAAIPALTEENTTNWLLLKKPGIYLYGCLLMAAPFMMDDARMSTFGLMYKNAVSGLIRSDGRARYAGATVRTPCPTP